MVPCEDRRVVRSSRLRRSLVGGGGTTARSSVRPTCTREPSVSVVCLASPDRDTVDLGSVCRREVLDNHVPVLPAHLGVCSGYSRRRRCVPVRIPTARGAHALRPGRGQPSPPSRSRRAPLLRARWGVARSVAGNSVGLASMPSRTPRANPSASDPSATSATGDRHPASTAACRPAGEAGADERLETRPGPGDVVAYEAPL